MLTAISEGYWKTDEATIRDIANTWAQATVQNGVACCDCSCGNIAMMQWAINYVNPDMLAKLLPKLYEATKNPVFLNASTNPTNPNTNNPKDPSTPNPQDGSNATTTYKSNHASSSNKQNSGSSDISNSNLGVGVDVASDSAASNGASVGDDGSESQDGKKASELNPVVSKSASETGLSILAVLGVLCLVLIIGVGYIRGRSNNENSDEEFEFDFDSIFDEL